MGERVFGTIERPGDVLAPPAMAQTYTGGPNVDESTSPTDPAPRSRVSKRLRMEVFRRDNHACRYCGAHAPDVKITIDHVVPVALGGSDGPANLVTACVDCNGGKSSVMPDAPTVDDVKDSALRWAHALKMVAADRRHERELFEEACDDFDDAWCRWTFMSGGKERVVPRDDAWQESLRRWLEVGVEVDELISLISRAMRSRAVKDKPREVWRYFCGCAWTAAREIQEQTRKEADLQQEIERHLAQKWAEADSASFQIEAPYPLMRSWLAGAG